MTIAAVDVTLHDLVPPAVRSRTNGRYLPR